MSILLTISNYIVPAFLALIVLYGLLKKIKVFECFIEGASEGLKTAVSILPTLMGLIVAIEMLQASGALDFITRVSGPVARWIGLPSEVLPIALIRPISGGGAVALLENLFKTHSPDSYIGRLASVLEGANETTFYVFSLYYSSVAISKTRHTLLCALFSDMTGLMLSGILVRWFYSY